ncbi:hypothetical protein [Rhizobium sp. A37_96]
MMQPAYIGFAANGFGEFAFGCVTGQTFGAGGGNHVAFSWQGSDEMDDARGDDSAEIQPDGFISGQSASITAAKLTSSPANGLPQHPASGFDGRQPMRLFSNFLGDF